MWSSESDVPARPPSLAIELAHRLREHGIAAPAPAAGDVFVDGDVPAWRPRVGNRWPAPRDRSTGAGGRDRARACMRCARRPSGGLPRSAADRISMVGFRCADGRRRRPTSTTPPRAAVCKRRSPATRHGDGSTAHVGRVPRRRPPRQRDDDGRRAGAHRLGPDVRGTGGLGSRDVAHARRALGRRRERLSGVRRRLRRVVGRRRHDDAGSPSCATWRRR